MSTMSEKKCLLKRFDIKHKLLIFQIRISLEENFSGELISFFPRACDLIVYFFI